MKYGIDIHEASNGATVTLYPQVNEVIAWDPSGNDRLYMGTVCPSDLFEAERIAEAWKPDPPKPREYSGSYWTFPNGVYRTVNHPTSHFTLVIQEDTALIIHADGRVSPAALSYTETQWHRVKDPIKDCCPVLDD